MAQIKYSFDSNSHRLNNQKDGKKKFFIIFALVIVLVGGLLWGGAELFSKNDQVANEQVVDIVEVPIDNNTKSTNNNTTNNNVTTPQTPKVEKKFDPEYEKDFAELKRVFAETDYQKSKTLALNMLKKYGEPDKTGPVYRQIGKFLSRLNIKMLFNGLPSDKLEKYKVFAGDNLNNIAIKYNLPVATIQKANNIKGVTIFPGQTLKIYKGDWKIEVNKEAKLLYVFDGDDLFALYDIGIGKEGRTPVGEFKLTDKIENPDWYSPDGRIVPYGDKENVLGTHWLKLEPINDTDASHIGYGIHGTWDTGSITRSLSNGCIRMINDEVAELFTYIPRQVIVVIY